MKSWPSSRSGAWMPLSSARSPKGASPASTTTDASPRGDASVVVDAGDAPFGDLADDNGIQAPLLEDGQDFILAPLLGHQQHALLGFAEHDFVGRHAGLALRNFGKVDLDAGAAARSHFHGGTGEAGGAHVLNRYDRAGLHGLEAGLKKQFL